MFVKWTDIESLHHVVRNYRKGEEAGYPIPTVTFRPKIKLHGTNAGVRVQPNGAVVAQQRTMDCDSNNPNFGFRMWVEAKADFFRSVASTTGQTVFFGEWCGSGIMDKCAIQQIGRKVFTIFAVSYTGDEGEENLVTDPFYIERMFHNAKVDLPTDIYILPWADGPITIDFNNREDLEAKAEFLSQRVLEVEACDPWVKATFGVDGIGEGLVYYPVFEKDLVQRELVTRPMFKAKGDKHKVAKTDKVVQVDVEKVNSVAAFVDMFVTEARCDQGVASLGNVIDPKMTGNFLGWMCKDIEKESKAELEVSGLTWKDVSNALSKKARDWYISKTKCI